MQSLKELLLNVLITSFLVEPVKQFGKGVSRHIDTVVKHSDTILSDKLNTGSELKTRQYKNRQYINELNIVQDEIAFLSNEKVQNMKRLQYIIDSFGGYINVVYCKPYRDGLEIVFDDFELVKYYRLKNFSRVFISEKQGSIILLPKKNIAETDFFINDIFN